MHNNLEKNMILTFNSTLFCIFLKNGSKGYTQQQLTN